MVSLLSARGRFDVVGHSSDPRACLSLLKEYDGAALVADEELLKQSAKDLVAGAKLLGGFSLIVVYHGDSAVDIEEADGAASIASGPEALFLEIHRTTEHLVRRRHARSRTTQTYGLSRREFEVANLVAKGYTNRRIAEITGIQEQSVKNVVSTVMRRLACENRTQVAIRLASFVPVETSAE
jgi:DNA-binding NarL/FixJ family response regulator